MDATKIKEQVRNMYDWTLHFFIHHMSDEDRAFLVQKAREMATASYRMMSSYEKFVFNSNYALLNVMHHGFMHDIDYDTKSLNNRMANMRYFVDCNKNNVGDEKPFYPFYPEFAIIGGQTKSFMGEVDMPITVSGILVLYTGKSPTDDSGISLKIPIQRPSDGRNARDFLNLYFSYIVSLCDTYYSQENIERFRRITNSWIDDRDVVPIMWAMMLTGRM